MNLCNTPYCEHNDEICGKSRRCSLQLLREDSRTDVYYYRAPHDAGSNRPGQYPHLVLIHSHSAPSAAANDSFGHNASFQAANAVHNYPAARSDSGRRRPTPARPRALAVSPQYRVSRTHPRWLGVKSIFDGGAYNLMSDAPRVHGSACVCAVILDVL